jgi:gamma-glutamyltranspeptidase/glutathione hydrolase
MTRHSPSFSRRRFLAHSSGLMAVSLTPAWARAELRPGSELGYVVGEPVVENIGARILADGGNAVDALIATALAGAVTQPHQTGLGGYATHGIFAMDNGRRIAALDGNTIAPAAFTKDIFQPDPQGRVPEGKNHHGWLAAGVPGVIAGLKLALDQFGTWSFADVMAPAIRLAREGFLLPPALAARIAANRVSFAKDPGMARLFFPGGSPPPAGSLLKNPELAELMMTLAKANSIEPFYRGEIAQLIAEGFARQGGLVTKEDLASYHARLVEPLKMAWGEHTIHTPPLTCGGISVLQMLAILKAMKWDTLRDGSQRLRLRVEAMRLAWRDRLKLLGDPEFAAIPHDKLLSEDYAAACAEQIMASLQAGQILEPDFQTKSQGGTLNFSACDRHGNMAALTLTHGDGLGAHVTIDGLGLTLGHGMSRFDPHPEHPNAPGPRKRPLHNMVPVLITKGTQPVVAIGGRGGRRIPNAMLEFLTQYVVHGKPFAESLSAPRLHTEGSKLVEHQPAWPKPSIAALKETGYTVKAGGSATLSGVARESTGWLAGMS